MVDKIFKALAAIGENFKEAFVAAIENIAEFISLFLTVLMVALGVIVVLGVVVAMIACFMVFISNITHYLFLAALGFLGCCLSLTIFLYIFGIGR